jgi:serine/threonine protein phosphatase PrpC
VAIDGSVVLLRWGACSDVGRVRTLNEDSFLARHGLFVVADGMGGHDAGEVASALVVSVLGALPSVPLPPIGAVAAALARANSAVFAAAGSDGITGSMGTTAVGLALVDNAGSPNWTIFNVGDSRCYRLKSGHLDRLTKDHSYVAELVDQGVITPEQAVRHPERNVVTRAFGTDPLVEPDYVVMTAEPGERFLLCTDGLYNELPDEEIAQLLVAEADPARAAEVLVREAVARAGRDNATAVVVDVGGDRRPVAAPAPELEADTLPVAPEPLSPPLPAARVLPPPPGGLIDGVPT